MDERTAEIISECKGIIEAIESHQSPLSRVALRARRLAQLLDDDAAFTWLSMECVGADGHAPTARPWSDDSGTERWKGVEKYVKIHAVRDLTNITMQELAVEVTKGKIADKTRVAGAPLAELEVENASLSKEERQQLSAVPGGQEILLATTAWSAERRKVLEVVAAAIHEWVTNVYVVHRFDRSPATYSSA